MIWEIFFFLFFSISDCLLGFHLFAVIFRNADIKRSIPILKGYIYLYNKSFPILYGNLIPAISTNSYNPNLFIVLSKLSLF